MRKTLITAGLFLVAAFAANETCAQQAVAVIPRMSEAVILESFAESCSLIGRVEAREPNAVVCNTTRIGQRYPTVIKMTYEPHADGFEIKTMSQVRFGGVLAWSRTPDNYPMDMVLARHVLEKQVASN